MAQSAQVVDVGGRRLRLSNLDKVLYPATGTTKAEVIDYYSRIAPVMLPHLAGRPVTRLRWPEGTGEPPFFAKDLEAGAPEWMPRHAIDHSGGAKDYPLVTDVAGLVYLAQVASLELHTPQWRFDHGGRGCPDRLVLDLDPGPGVGLAECAEVARRARGILSDMGMEPLPVTSGSKGIHLYAPLDANRSSDEISAFARELARALEADDPALVVSAMSKAARPGKVFVDWSQNNAAKTTIAPYSLRGRAHPTVAAPRTWAELDDPDLRHLLLDEVLARAASDGDLLAALASGAPDPLAPYMAKRTPAATPEPFPSSRHVSAEPPRSGAPNHGGSAESWRFVIQEHHASRLHWDLRLERDGVLVSWAVPRGIPDSPDRNHMAVMTEPHPIEYLTFAGEIPAGEYGAGTMTVWDSGTFTVEKWRDDEVIATLSGRTGGPLGQVRLALIRTSGTGEKSQWLLHRTKDAATPPVRAARAGHRATSRALAGSDAPMLAVSTTPALAASAARRWGDAPWVEFKWDGIRAIGTWDGERLHLRARSGTDITERYPELTAADLGLGALPAVIDGEIVALDADGRPSFTRLQSRMHLTGVHEIAREAQATPVHYFVFDLLRVGNDDVSAHPLRERRDLLLTLTADAAAPLVVPPVTDDIADALTAAADLQLEGVVVKDPRSPYRRGERSQEWLKVKLTAMQEVVIGGIRPGKGERRDGIGSLLLGIPDAEGLRYVGRVGSGFSERELGRLEQQLQPLRTEANPFIGVPASDAADALWLRPELVGEVEYAEFTPNGTLRHARWRGLRAEKQPADVRREE
ncbi:MAG: ATP-dependent DNA ligase [Microbacterium sp. 69-7]|uniref:DNA ligase (ATP) n=1 Tax=Microbacterium laevaniformans TaxID=36807 RepID=A0A150H6P4_9MICO|nr:MULTISPECIES: ATP-dependent DNA ligase [Microbacterium]KXZ57721.1 putative DNA ligase-like protein [Microbacterium laevaniformans]OJU44661.1 MAG: ATP-dependent DNA ligase [Microbacterium sp. 69-7]